jgi:hypothetical protein
MSETERITQSSSGPSTNEKPKWGTTLAVLMAATILLHGIVWVTGVKDYDLADAVERGAGRVEERQKGEESEDVIRKSINLQRDTLPFWTVITLIGDFLFAPLALVVRPLMVAVAFAAIAAATGRVVRFPVVMSDCVNWQAVWVLGLGVQVILMLVLWRSHIETSVLLLLPPGEYRANTWVMLQQLDCFALLGWLGMASVGWQRRQANWIMAVLTCLFLWGVEMMVVSSASLVVNLGMRSSLMPGS